MGNLTDFDMETVPFREVPSWGQWALWARELESLAPGQVKRVTPRLTKTEVRALRSAVRWRQHGLHVRNEDNTTYLWLGEQRPKGGTPAKSRMEKYRKFRAPKK